MRSGSGAHCGSGKRSKASSHPWSFSQWLGRSGSRAVQDGGRQGRGRHRWGSVAMDCVESALKLGAKDAYLVYRRSFAQMPAEEGERLALRQGVHFLLLNQPKEFLAERREGSRAWPWYGLASGSRTPPGAARPWRSRAPSGPRGAGCHRGHRQSPRPEPTGRADGSGPQGADHRGKKTRKTSAKAALPAVTSSGALPWLLMRCRTASWRRGQSAKP